MKLLMLSGLRLMTGPPDDG